MIWLDISLLRTVRGTPFGIARVERQLAELLKSRVDLGYFWVDSSSRVHFSKQPSSLNGFNTETSKVIPQSKINSIQILKNEQFLIRIGRIASILISLLPQKTAEKMWLIGVRVYNKLLIFSTSKIKKKIRFSKLRNDSENTKKYLLDDATLKMVAQDDIFLIASNDWDRRIYQHLEDAINFKPKLSFIIYDLIPYYYPNFAVDPETASRFTYWIGDIAQKAENLFHISNYTLQSFEKMVEMREINCKANMHIISLPPGLEVNGKIVEPSFSARLEKDFILCVGTLEVRKNHKILLAAANEALRLQESFPQLVFVGSKGWGYEEIRRDLELNEALNKRVLHFEGVYDDELRWLYQHCSKVVYPSIIEGYGLPIIEAASFGKKVICSTAESFKEFDGLNIVKLSPYDAIAWKNELQVTEKNKESTPPVNNLSYSWEKLTDFLVHKLAL